MLPTLPPELLREIIEASIPHSFHSNTYRARQNTLLSLSLVSERFRAIAQPLLRELVRINSSRDIKFISAAPEGRDEGGEGSQDEGNGRLKVHAIKQAVVDTPASELWWSDSMASVESLTIFKWVIPCCLDLGSLKYLTSLHLSSVKRDLSVFKRDSPQPQPLRHLQSLTLRWVEPSLSLSLLSPVVLPTLRNLAFDDESSQALSRSMIDQILPQLETFCISSRLWTSTTATFLHGAVDKTLIDSSLNDVSQFHAAAQTTPIAFIRILTPSSHLEGQPMAAALVDNFASFVGKKSPPTLRAIYLDASFGDPTSDPSLLRRSIEDLARMCRQQKIEIVFELGPSRVTIDPFISLDFGRRQKRYRDEAVKGDSGGIQART